MDLRKGRDTSNHDILVKNGRIKAIGKNLVVDPEERTEIINGKGKHLTPGIIDCHSHAMILGGVNESTLPSTAMVRIADVINSESINIERQLPVESPLVTSFTVRLTQSVDKMPSLN